MSFNRSCLPDQELEPGNLRILHGVLSPRLMRCIGAGLRRCVIAEEYLYSGQPYPTKLPILKRNTEHIPMPLYPVARLLDGLFPEGANDLAVIRLVRQLSTDLATKVRHTDTTADYRFVASIWGSGIANGEPFNPGDIIELNNQTEQANRAEHLVSLAEGETERLSIVYGRYIGGDE